MDCPLPYSKGHLARPVHGLDENYAPKQTLFPVQTGQNKSSEHSCDSDINFSELYKGPLDSSCNLKEVRKKTQQNGVWCPPANRPTPQKNAF